MSTLDPDLLKEIALTVDLGERLTLIIVFGPGYLAEEGLAEVREAVGTGRYVVQHRLDRLGPNIAETVAGAGDSRPVLLVRGLERMAAERRDQVQVSMNLLRDTLSKHPAAVVMWIPVEIADEFRRLCVDLFQWRTLTVYVEGREDEERRIRHDYLVSLATATLTPATSLGRRQIPEVPVSAVSESRVRVEGEDEPQGVESWLASVPRGLLLGSAGSGKTTALRRYAARRAEELLDGEGGDELPVVIAARQLLGLGEEARSWLEQQLASVPAILLIDGLDEVPWVLQANFNAQIRRVVARNPRVRVVFAGRAAFDPVSDWPKAEVLPLEPEAIAMWLRNVGYDPAAFMTALAFGGAEELAATPLSLQLVTTLADPAGNLLDLDFTDLIGKIVDSRLGHWDFGKGISLRVPGSIAEIRNELAELAGKLMEADSETAQLGRTILGFVAERSGIIREDDDAQSKYEFTHRLFRDYFAGCWLAAQDPDPDRLAGYAADPAWRPPTLHALNLLGQREFEGGIEKIWETSADQPPPARWAMRMLVLQATLARRDRGLRTRFIERAKAVVDRARRDVEPPSLWTPLADLLDRANKPS